MDRHFSPDVSAAESVDTMLISLELGGLQRGGLPDLQLLYTLSGFSELTINGLRHIKQEVGSIHIINPWDRYEITGMDNFAAVLFRIDMRYFCELMPTLSEKRFSITAMGAGQDDYDALSLLLSKSLKIFTSEGENNPVLQGLAAHRIMLLLLKKFQIIKKYGLAAHTASDAAVKQLMAYIDQNSTEKLTLQFLSELVHLNSQYLSRLFKKETGITLIRYINLVRVINSEKDVLYGSLRAADIAEKYGFASTKAFYSAFRSVFGKAPGKHKADMQKETSIHPNFRLRCPSPLLYTREMVKQFVNAHDNTRAFDPADIKDQGWSPTDVMEYKVACAINGKFEPLHHLWSLSSRESSFAPSVPVQSPTLQWAFVRISDLQCYNENAKGEPVYDFTRLDKQVDSCLSRHMSLVLEVFFMPVQLAREPEAAYLQMGATSPPRDLSQWISFVTALVSHLVDRHGVGVMRTAQFSLWNDPTVRAYWSGTQEEFFTFAAHTARAIKAVDARLPVGLLELYPEAITAQWLKSLKAAFDAQETSLDFIGNTIPFIKNDSGQTDVRYPLETGWGYLLADSGYPLRMAVEFKKKLTQSGLIHTKYYLTGMLPTGLPGELTHRTCFLSAYIVKTILDSAPIAAHVNFSAVPTTSGGMLFSQGYNVFRLLGKLGTRILRKGDNYVVTTCETGRCVSVLCFNYCHYHESVRTPEQLRNITPSSLYNAFEHGDEIHLTITLKNMYGGYRLKKYALTPRFGSPFDAWVALGAPNALTEEETEYLESKTVPDYTSHVVQLDGEYTIFSSVGPNEIELFEFCIQE